jgi:predicted nuclease of predicted toxin-antitoxin system
VKILLDHCVPKRLKRAFATHEVKTTREMGWEKLKNGHLLDQAQTQFEILITVDRNIRHQQNLIGRTIAVVIMEASSNSPQNLLPLVSEVEKILSIVQPGSFYSVRVVVTAEGGDTG